jgi:ribosomal protein L37AE/L43A
LLNPMESHRQGSQKICPECGNHTSEQEHYNLQECDHCLSKKEEI